MDLLYKKEYRVQPFRSILIGDPKYLINMETKKSTTRYIADFKNLPTKNRLCGAVISATEDGFFTKNKILIYSVKNEPVGEAVIKAHLEDRYISNKLERFRFLRNDTEKLAIVADDNKVVYSISEGEFNPHDGACGQIWEYRKGLGVFIEITTCDLRDYIEKHTQIIYKVFKEVKEREDILA